MSLRASSSPATEDRHGDAVNVAARLQELADRGGVCVSQQVVDHTRQKLAVGFELRGCTIEAIRPQMRVGCSIDKLSQAHRNPGRV